GVVHSLVQQLSRRLSCDLHAPLFFSQFAPRFCWHVRPPGHCADEVDCTHEPQRKLTQHWAGCAPRSSGSQSLPWQLPRSAAETPQLVVTRLLMALRRMIPCACAWVSAPSPSLFRKAKHRPHIGDSVVREGLDDAVPPVLVASKPKRSNPLGERQPHCATPYSVGCRRIRLRRRRGPKVLRDSDFKLQCARARLPGSWASSPNWVSQRGGGSFGRF